MTIYKLKTRFNAEWNEDNVQCKVLGRKWPSVTSRYDPRIRLETEEKDENTQQGQSVIP
jgi:hypothetical protein